MSNLKREIGKAKRKLQKAKNSGETLEIIRKLKAEKPEVYKAMQNEKGE